MVGIYILIIIVLYFGVLLLISHLTSRRSDNDAFFLANRQSPWYLVAIGMIGASISGVTFISVPGVVGNIDMTYMQMVLGFIPGYLIVAYVLLPLYYKLQLTTIYGYLEQRFGQYSYKTGASFFILSRIIGSAAKLYLVVLVLQTLVFDQWNVPFPVTVACIIAMIWLYTHRSGIKTIVWTDTLQTICVVVAVILIIYQVASQLGMGTVDIFRTVVENEHSRIFVFDDWASTQNFFKQFFSGILIVIVMTGLDQDMMQKNLTIRTLKDAQKNMIFSGISFTPLNLLFMGLGVLLLVYASARGIALPEKTDEILPYIVTNYLGVPALICFTIGIIASSFANADSALTSLTTTVCVDLLGIGKRDDKASQKLRRLVHALMSIVFLFVILIIHLVGQNNVLDTIYKAASYTYGPLLGLFFYGLFTKKTPRDALVPVVCVLAPALCFVVDWYLLKYFGYKVGYEILLFNGLITVLGLWLLSLNRPLAERKNL
ncbi:sodium:solute symporter [Dysgonomonas sp. 25]|uniref:sodium:solute symporter n=1 Tax=Dysgonomonas sp. 25 TaxID=2302933 RepID=UPI00351B1F67